MCCRNKIPTRRRLNDGTWQSPSEEEEESEQREEDDAPVESAKSALMRAALRGPSHVPRDPDMSS